MSLDENLRDRILEANVAVHKSEAKYYELIHPEVYSRFEQKRVTSTLKLVDKLVAVDGVNEKRVLDVGAGTGNLTGKFLQMGYHVTAIDISKKMCSLLQNKYKDYVKENKLKIINSSIEESHIKENFEHRKIDIVF